VTLARVLVRRVTASGLVPSASMDPKVLTLSDKWVPVVDGAAGEEESIGFGESTVPNAIAEPDISVQPVREQLTSGWHLHCTSNGHATFSRVAYRDG
jgi:hypothetical protein